MKTLTKLEAAKMIRELNGKMFSCSFIKKDGTLRQLNARTGVSKHTKGGVSTIADKEHLIGVYDVKNNGYRCININTLQSLKAAGNEYKIV